MKSFFLPLLALCASNAFAEDAPVVIRGVVKEQIHHCEVDGICAVVVKTDAGDQTVVWNEGEKQPDRSCPPDFLASRMASKLNPGDTVELHVHQSGKAYKLCGAGAQVMMQSR